MGNCCETQGVEKKPAQKSEKKEQFEQCVEVVSRVVLFVRSCEIHCLNCFSLN